MDCSICLERMKKNQKIFQLSCNHQFHYHCFLTYAFKNGGHIFINCPLCREMNVSNERPYDSPVENIRALCSKGVGKVRCHHTTKKGHQCKNPSALLNYGYCRLHHKELLPKCKYPLMCDYMFHLLESPNQWRTKIISMDICKKLLMKHDGIKTIQDIQYYFFRYFNHHKNINGKTNKYIIPNGIYEYYDLELPPSDWVQYCTDRHKII